MPTWLGDALNFGASIVTVVGAIVSVIGFMRKLSMPHAGPALPQGDTAQPGFPASAAASVATATVATATHRRIPHPLILSASALAILMVLISSVILLTQLSQSSPNDTPVTISLILMLVDLIAGEAAAIGLLVAAARGNQRGWLIVGIISLFIVPFGLISIVALVPIFFFALYDHPYARAASKH